MTDRVFSLLKSVSEDSILKKCYKDPLCILKIKNEKILLDLISRNPHFLEIRKNFNSSFYERLIRKIARVNGDYIPSKKIKLIIKNMPLKSLTNNAFSLLANYYSRTIFIVKKQTKKFRKIAICVDPYVVFDKEFSASLDELKLAYSLDKNMLRQIKEIYGCLTYDFADFILKQKKISFINDFNIRKIINENKKNIEYMKNLINNDIAFFNLIKNPSRKLKIELIKHKPHILSILKNPTEEEITIAISKNLEIYFNINRASKKLRKLLIEKDPQYILNIPNPSVEEVEMILIDYPELLAEMTILPKEIIIKYNTHPLIGVHFDIVHYSNAQFTVQEIRKLLKNKKEFGRKGGGKKIFFVKSDKKKSLTRAGCVG